MNPRLRTARSKSVLSGIAAALAIAASLAPGSHSASTRPHATEVNVIVQASDLAHATRAVRSVGGIITHELEIIDAVGARLSAEQAEALGRSQEIRRIYPNYGVEV